MKVKVMSRDPVTDKEKNMIRGIMRESECPNESIRSTFRSRYLWTRKDTIFFDCEAGTICTEIEY